MSTKNVQIEEKSSKPKVNVTNFSLLDPIRIKKKQFNDEQVEIFCKPCLSTS